MSYAHTYKLVRKANFHKISTMRRTPIGLRGRQIIFVRLSRTKAICNRKSCEEPPLKGTFHSFETFGFYDSIEFQIIENRNSIEQVIGQSSLREENTILIPQRGRLTTKEFKESCFGAISFLLVDEQPDTDLFALAKTVNRRMSVEKENMELKMQSNAFVTMGASAIAILSLSQERDGLFISYQDYMHRLQELMAKNQQIVYTYTILFTRPDRLQNVVDSGKDELESVTLSFSNHPEQPYAVNKAFFEDLRKELNAKYFSWGVIPGTEDYIAIAHNVTMSKLMTLYQRDNLLSSAKPKNSTQWYGDYFSAIQTALCFRPEEGKNREISIQNEVPFTGNHTRDDFPQIERRVKSFSAFKDLKTSPYTRWVYLRYYRIVSLYEELLAEIKEDEDAFDLYQNNTYQETRKFCDWLNHMLESLLNTSAYMTISPTYRKTDYNFLPRLLLCYQTKINELVSKWDCQYGTDRKHLFFLHGLDGNSVRAYMFFSHLPPDRRIISVDVPLLQALQPEILLPMLLHEAGHSIGVRCRRIRREYYIRVATHRFCDELLLHMFEKKDIEEILHILRYPNSDHSGALLSHAYVALSEGFEEICNRVREDYAIFKEQYLHYFVDNTVKKNAIEQDYCSEISLILRRVFFEMLAKDSLFIFNLFHKYFVDLSKTITPNVSLQKYYNKIIDKAREMLPYVYAGLAEHDQYRSADSFLSDGGMILEEVAADIFMVRMCGMSSTNYLQLRFDQYHMYDERWLKDFRRTPYAYSQVASVYCTLLFAEHPDCTPNINDTLIENISCVQDEYEAYCMLSRAFSKFDINRLRSLLKNEKKRNIDCYHGQSEKKGLFEKYVSFIVNLIFRNCVIQQQDQWIRDFQKIANPIEITMEYAWLIYNDIRYSQLEDQVFKFNNNACVQNLALCRKEITNCYHSAYRSTLDDTLPDGALRYLYSATRNSFASEEL